MSECKISIWYRVFDLNVVYECYPGEEVLETQREAFTMFKENTEAISESLEAVKKYVLKTNAGLIADESIENIFKYVMPRSLFVPHTKNHRTIAILCNYKFDIEHGIAVVFENGKFKMVGMQDIIL